MPGVTDEGLKMTRIHNPKLKTCAQKLRKNMTKEERSLWYDFLKNQTAGFARQKVFGNYIVDFYCAEYKLVIELDGSQHYDTEGEKSDALRDTYLRSLGLTVLRFTNLEIARNFDGVCKTIATHIGIDV